MDLSKLSDKDLEAIKVGDLSKVSDEGLKAIADSKDLTSEGQGRALKSGLADYYDNPKDAETPGMGYDVRPSPRTGLPVRVARPGQLAANAKGGAIEAYKMSMRGGLPAIGQAAGVATGPFAAGAVPALGAVGGFTGELLAGGDLKAAIVAAGVGAIPGSPIAQGGRQLGLQMARDAGVNTVAVNAESIMRGNGMASLEQNALAMGLGGLSPVIGKAIGGAVVAKNPARDAFLANNSLDLANARSLIAEGGALPGSALAVDDAFMESMAGPEYLRKRVLAQNQPVLRGKLRKDFGIGGTGPISFGAIELSRKGANAPYAAIAASSKEAAKEMASLDELRRELSKQYSIKNSPVVGPEQLKAKERIEALRPLIERSENLMEIHAQAIGDPNRQKAIQEMYAMRDAAQSAEATFAAREAERIRAGGNALQIPRSISSVQEPVPFASNAGTADDFSLLSGPEVNQYFRDKADYELSQAWAKANARAGTLERRLMQQAPDEPGDLIKEFRKARATHAKIHKAEDVGAIKFGSGHLKVGGIANEYGSSGTKNMTGGLEDIAKIGQSFPRYTADPSDLTSAQAGRFDQMFAAMMAKDTAQGNWLGAALAGIPLLRKTAQDRILSPEYQRNILKKALEPSRRAPENEISAMIARLSTMSAGRQEAVNRQPMFAVPGP